MRMSSVLGTLAAALASAAIPAHADMNGTWTGTLKCTVARADIPAPDNIYKTTVSDFSMTFSSTSVVEQLETGTVTGVGSQLFLACDGGGTYKFVSDGREGVVQYLSNESGACGDNISEVAHGTVKEGSRSSLKLSLSQTRNDSSPAVANCVAALRR